MKISDYQKNRIEMILHDCYSKTSELNLINYPNSLLDGGIGICLFNLMYEKSYSIKKETGLINLEKILEEKEVTNGSLCSGSAGILWLLSKIKLNNIVDFEDCLLQDLKDHCINSFIFEIQNENNDFLYGSFGILYSLIISNVLTDSELSLLVTELEKNRPITGIYKTNLKPSYRPEGINLHLAHGIASYIIVSCELFKLTKSEFVKDMIESHMDILVSNFKYGEKSIFPSEDGFKDRNIRNGWCYGDIGIGLAFYAAGKTLNKSYFIKKSIDIFRFTISKTTLKQSQIYDFSVCHGLMGNLLLYYKICNHILKESNSSIINVYLMKVIAFYNRYGVKSMDYKDIEGYCEKNGILLGYSGIGLVCLTLLEKQTFNWEEILLV
ncbi:MAG: hypothetical protein M9897_08810 [Brumimicrobium sp.]|nr:hypothetical protein [Brumimicrobium sp.]